MPLALMALIALTVSAPVRAMADSVVVGFGGYASCRRGELEHPVARGVLGLVRTIEARALIACFGLTSSDPVVEGASTTLPELVAKIVTMARATRTRQVVIIGHSHGGWLALQVALRLPVDVQLAYLVTLDPISLLYCGPLEFASIAPAEAIGDPHSLDCQRFPRDVDESQQASIAKRSLGWLGYHQAQTMKLRSSAPKWAHRAREVVLPVEDGEAHQAIADDPGIWREIAEVVRAGRALPEAVPAITPSPPAQAAFALPELYRSWHVGLRYRKAAVGFLPRLGRGDEARVFQPNAEPFVVLDHNLSVNVGLSYARTVPFLKARDQQLGHTEAQVFDAHFRQGRWGFDFFAHDYRSLFADHVHRGDLRPFRDAAFGGVDRPDVLPTMRLVGGGVDALYTLWPAQFSQIAAMSPAVVPLRSGWSPIGVLSLRSAALSHDRPLLPAGFAGDQAPLGPNSYRSRSLAALPGLAGLVVQSSWYAAAFAAYGFGYQHIAFDKVYDLPATSTSARGSLGYFTEDGFAGVVGYYGAINSSAGALNVNETLSSVEVFAGRRF